MRRLRSVSARDDCWIHFSKRIRRLPGFQPVQTGQRLRQLTLELVEFEQYTFLRTIPAASVDIGSKGKRLIFIGDVHGSYEPLRSVRSSFLSFLSGSFECEMN
jgi:hypothetical protein